MSSKTSKNLIAVMAVTLLLSVCVQVTLAACGPDPATLPSWHTNSTHYNNDAVNINPVVVAIPNENLSFAEVTQVYVSFVYSTNQSLSVSPRVSADFNVGSSVPIIMNQGGAEEYLNLDCSQGSPSNPRAPLGRIWRSVEIGRGQPKDLSISLTTNSAISGEIEEYYIAVFQHGAKPPSP